MSANGTVPQPQSFTREAPDRHDVRAPRRIATLDIETISLDLADPKGALDAMTGRIVCIGLLFDDGQRLEQHPISDLDEKKLLERFWTTIRDTDLLVGHNILAFDLMFIRQRSWILGVKPPLSLNLKKYYTDQVVDLMALWTNWSNRISGASLENIAWALDCGEKTGHGSEVAMMWNNGEYIRIMDYCMQDVWMAYRIYCRMHYREPLGVPMPTLSVPARTTETRELVPVAASRSASSITREAPDAYDVRAHVAPSSAPAYFHAQLPAPHIPETPRPGAATSQPPRPPRRRRESKREGNREIVYRTAGNSLVLSGDGTFPIKETLKNILGARGTKVSENPNRYEWAISADKWESLAGLCAQIGITLVPAGAGRTGPQNGRAA